MTSYKKKQELADLWRKYKIDRDLNSRNKLIVHYGFLVKLVVNRLGMKYKNYIDEDDLISYGILGLMDAIEKYDITKGIKFDSYASYRIRGSIIDQIRKQDWIPRSLRQKSKQVEDAMFELENKLGRPPKEDELADHLSMTIEDVHEVTKQINLFTVLSFEEQIINTKTKMELSEKQWGTPEESILTNELKEMLAKAIDSLKEKERKIISLYYFDELTFKEIGIVLGISESRVSQLHKRALTKLKNQMNLY